MAHVGWQQCKCAIIGDETCNTFLNKMVRYLYKIILITQTTLSCVVHSGKPRYYYHTVLLYYEVNHTYTSQVLICVVFEQIYVIIQHIFDCDGARYHIQGRPFCPKGDVLPHIWGKTPFLCKSIKLKSRFILILSFISAYQYFDEHLAIK